MKLVVFAHTPPPFHGQSYMVRLMIDGLGGDCRRKLKWREQSQPDGIQCFHVNARFSNDLVDVGAFRFQKIPRLLKYCAEAIWCRFRYGADTLYYIPAPPKRFAFYRDCLVLLLCRPFFRRLVFHWEASGLGEWLQRAAFPWERTILQSLFSNPDLSIAVAKALSDEAVYLRSRRVCIVPNGIPDLCPTFESSVLPLRSNRVKDRRQILESRSETSGDQKKYRVLFLAHCTREKGLFDTLSAIVFANQQLADLLVPIRLHITIAGSFLYESERREFESWQGDYPNQADYVGFVAGDAKTKLLRESDCLCFPTYYSAEAQPVSIIEAMAFGLTIVASAWRGIPELLPKDYPLVVAPRDISGIAQALIESMKTDLARQLRQHYCDGFTEKSYSHQIAKALRSSEAATDRT